MNNKHLTYRFISGTTIGAALILAGCASAPDVTAADLPPTKVEAAEVEPLSVVKPRKVVDNGPAKPGSFDSLVDKLQSDGLYWREKQSYSFNIGREMGAEYQPEQGLKVTATTDDGAVECNFKSDGSFASDKKLMKTCQNLMFTLDQELGD